MLGDTDPQSDQIDGLLSQLMTDIDARHLVRALKPEIVPRVLTGLLGRVDAALACNELEAATKTIEFAEEMAREIGADWADARCAYARGRVESANGTRPAAEAFDRAAQHADEPDQRVMALANAGQNWLSAGDLMAAERCFRSAIDLSRPGNNLAGIAHGQLGLARVASARNDHKAAAGLLHDALRAARVARDPELELLVGNELGIVNAALGQLDAAADAYRNADEALSRAALAAGPRHRIAAGLVANRAALALRNGDLATASLLKKQLTDGVAGLTPPDLLGDLQLIGIISMMEGDVAAARRHLLSALRMAERLGHEHYRWTAGTCLARVYTVAGHYEPAHRVCAGAIDGLERMRARAGGVRERLDFFVNKDETYELMVGICLFLAEIRREPRYHEEALSYIERARSRTFIELLGLAAIPPPSQVPLHLREQEASLMKLARAAAAAAAGGDSSTPVDGSLGDEELSLVWDEMAASAPEYVDLRRGRPMAFADIHRWVSTMTDSLRPSDGR